MKFKKCVLYCPEAPETQNIVETPGNFFYFLETRKTAWNLFENSENVNDSKTFKEMNLESKKHFRKLNVETKNKPRYIPAFREESKNCRITIITLKGELNKASQELKRT